MAGWVDLKWGSGPYLTVFTPSTSCKLAACKNCSNHLLVNFPLIAAATLVTRELQLIYQTLPVDIGVFPPLISLSVFPVAILTRVWVMPCASMVLVREAGGYQNGFIFRKVLNDV